MNEIDIVRNVLSSYQQAYAKAHCTEGKGVIESDGIAIGYASVELAKLLAIRDTLNGNWPLGAPTKREAGR